MEFFDKLGKKASQAYKVTAEKTTKLTKEAKLKMKIAENKSDINDLYEQIGKKVYEKHIREESLDIKKDLEEECTKIDVLAAEIENDLKECLELNDKKQCPSCEKQIEKDAKFCPECGEKQTEEVVREVEVIEKSQESEKEENQNEEPEKETTISNAQDDEDEQ